MPRTWVAQPTPTFSTDPVKVMQVKRSVADVLKQPTTLTLPRRFSAAVGVGAVGASPPHEMRLNTTNTAPHRLLTSPPPRRSAPGDEAPPRAARPRAAIHNGAGPWVIRAPRRGRHQAIRGSPRSP